MHVVPAANGPSGVRTGCCMCTVLMMILSVMRLNGMVLIGCRLIMLPRLDCICACGSNLLLEASCLTNEIALAALWS